MGSPEINPLEQKFDITSEAQLADYRIVGVMSPNEQEGRERAQRNIERAKQLIKEKGGLTEAERHGLGLYRKDEDVDTSI